MSLTVAAARGGQRGAPKSGLIDFVIALGSVVEEEAMRWLEMGRTRTAETIPPLRNATIT